MRVEGLPLLNLWSQILHTLSEDPSSEGCRTTLSDTLRKYYAVSLESVDYMPASLPMHVPNTRLTMCEDNDAVIKMLKKGRAPAMTHVARTHRVNLDWLLQQSLHDPCIFCRYIETKSQIADILTKPNFSVKDWCNLCSLLRLGPPPESVKRRPTAASIQPLESLEAVRKQALEAVERSPSVREIIERFESMKHNLFSFIASE